MAIRRIGPSRGLVGTRISRKDFLRIGGTGLAGAALLGTAGCSVFESQGGQQSGGAGKQSNESIVYNLGDTIRDLDSTTTTDSVSTDILLLVSEGLYRLDENTEPQPAQAEGVEISSDKLTYEFTLRDGIKWSDGSPVTSQDFRYAWMRGLDPKTAGQYAYILSTFVKGAAEFNAGDGSAEDVAIEAPDDKTLRVELVAPSPFWLGLTSLQFAYMPQKQEFVEQQGDQYAQSADALLYNGPYLLTELDPTKGVTLQKNKDYWNADNVDIEKVEGNIVKEADTVVNLYESGGLDVAGVEGEYVTEYKDSPEFTTRTFFATFYFAWNYDIPIFQNANVRKAIQLGVDREAIANKILNNGSVAASGYVPDGLAGPGSEKFREAVGPTMPEYDPQQAKKLFQKGIEEIGENPTVELLSYDDSVAKDIATFMQSELENLGMKIDVKIQPFDRKLELEAEGNFDLSYQGWIADYDDPMTFLDLFESESSFNTGKYSNPKYDKLVSDAKEETDFGKRMDLLIEAEKVLVEEDAGVAPIYFQGAAFLVKPYLKNYVYHPYGGGRDVSLWRVE
jgi:oligopeptide transport system substrate-binding protein